MKLFLISIFSLVLFSSMAFADSFFNGLPDVPLMAGLVEVEDSALSFDKPEGRILIAQATIDDSLSDSQVVSFYDQALPEFGWKKMTGFSYLRGLETLEIVFHKESDNRIFEIKISP